MLAEKCQRIAFEPQGAQCVFEFKFIMLAWGDAADESGPDSGGEVEGERIGPAVEMIPVTHDADAPGVGGPHGESVAGHSTDSVWVCAENVIESTVCAFGNEVAIVVGQEHGGRHVFFLAHRVRNALPCSR